MIRAAFVTELPTPYRIPLFERIQDLPGIGVEFLFMAKTESDRSWSRGWSGPRKSVYRPAPRVLGRCHARALHPDNTKYR